MYIWAGNLFSLSKGNVQTSSKISLQIWSSVNTALRWDVGIAGVDVEDLLPHSHKGTWRYWHWTSWFLRCSSGWRIVTRTLAWTAGGTRGSSAAQPSASLWVARWSSWTERDRDVGWWQYRQRWFLFFEDTPKHFLPGLKSAWVSVPTWSGRFLLSAQSRYLAPDRSLPPPAASYSSTCLGPGLPPVDIHIYTFVHVPGYKDE